jgi:hypothetical protein
MARKKKTVAEEEVLPIPPEVEEMLGTAPPLDIRDALIEHLKGQFEETLSDKRIKLAAVIFTVEGDDEPQLYRKGHFYDTATMLNHVMNAYRARAAVELGL